MSEGAMLPPRPVVSCDNFDCRECHPSVRYDFSVPAVDERAAITEAARIFADVPGADRYTILKSEAWREQSFTRGPAERRPEWFVAVTAEEKPA